MRHDQRLPRWQIHHSMRSHRSHRSLVRHDGISLASSPARSRDRPSLSTSASPRAVPVPAAPVRVHSRVRVHSSVSSARLSRVSPTRARARPPWTPHRARTRRIFHRRELFDGDRSSSSSRARRRVAFARRRRRARRGVDATAIETRVDVETRIRRPSRASHSRRREREREREFKLELSRDRFESRCASHRDARDRRDAGDEGRRTRWSGRRDCDRDSRRRRARARLSLIHI